MKENTYLGNNTITSTHALLHFSNEALNLKLWYNNEHERIRITEKGRAIFKLNGLIKD